MDRVVVMACAVDVQWMPDISWKMILEVQGDYERYFSLDDENAGSPNEVPAEVGEDIDDVFS